MNCEVLSQEGIPIEDEEVLMYLAEAGDKRVFFREASRTSAGGGRDTPTTFPTDASSPSTSLGCSLEELGKPSDGEESHQEPGNVSKEVDIIRENVEEASFTEDGNFTPPQVSTEKVRNNVELACNLVYLVISLKNRIYIPFWI